MKKIIKFLNVFFKPYISSKFRFFKVAESSIFLCHKIRGGKDCYLKIGDDSIVHALLSFERANAKIDIGKRTFIGKSNITSSTEIYIGDDILISSGVNIVDHNSHSLIYSEREKDVLNWKIGKKDWSNVIFKPVHIHNKVWIGFDSIILKGVTIGEGAIVGAGSVVTKDVPPWTIVAGNPARVIREIPVDER